MDQFKFKVWDKTNKKWVGMDDNFNCCKECGNRSIYHEIIGFGVDKTISLDGKFVNCEIVQYIGFKDKNNKEIYNGDIAKFGNNWRPKQIVWQDGRYWLGNTLIICCEMECKEMVVIGNIYENPELLK